jgi:hypothetical protein
VLWLSALGVRVPRSRDRGEAYTREREANGSVVSVQVALGMASSCSGTMDSPLTNTCCVHSEPHNVLASRRNGGVVVAILSAEEWTASASSVCGQLVLLRSLCRTTACSVYSSTGP